MFLRYVKSYFATFYHEEFKIPFLSLLPANDPLSLALPPLCLFRNYYHASD